MGHGLQCHVVLAKGLGVDAEPMGKVGAGAGCEAAAGREDRPWGSRRPGEPGPGQGAASTARWDRMHQGTAVFSWWQEGPRGVRAHRRLGSGGLSPGREPWP